MCRAVGTAGDLRAALAVPTELRTDSPSTWPGQQFLGNGARNQSLGRHGHLGELSCASAGAIKLAIVNVYARQWAYGVAGFC